MCAISMTRALKHKQAQRVPLAVAICPHMLAKHVRRKVWVLSFAQCWLHLAGYYKVCMRLPCTLMLQWRL